MEDKLYEKLDQLDIQDINLLLNEEIQLSLDTFTRKRIEKAVKQKAGYYPENNKLKDKINDILGGLIMKRKMALALSGALLLSLGGGGYAYAKTTPVAYVSLDINPSVELAVNTFDQVVSAEAYNEDGKKVLEGTNLVNTNVDKAVSTVISNAIADGYVKEDGTSGIEITTSTDKESVADKLEDTLKEAASKTLDNNNVEATVETENVALERRDEARKLGITPGKLNLIQKLQALDPSIKVEDYKASSVKDIMKKTKELRKANKQAEENSTDNTQNTTTVDQNKSTVTQDADTQEDLTKTSTASDSNKSEATKEKNNNSSYAKENNGKKTSEDNSKEEDVNKSAAEKNGNNSANSQGKNNSSKVENADRGNSENKGKNK